MSDSYPRPGFNSGVVTEMLYERLAAPQAADGLIGTPNDPPLVYADGVGTRTVRLRANRQALVRGFQFDSGTTDIDIGPLPGNTSGTSRVDLIVLRLTRATWRVQETFIQGTPGQGAPAPLSTDAVFDIPVAEVTVAHNAASLAPGTVIPRAWYVGDDGQILCTVSTRPPRIPGRRIYEYDSGRSWLSTGSAWLPAGDDTSPLTVPLVVTGWGSSVNVLHRRNGLVFLALSLQRLNTRLSDGAYSTIGTLPSHCRPLSVFEGLAYAQSAGPGRFVVNPNGTVQVQVYDGLDATRFVNLHPVCFPAA